MAEELSFWGWGRADRFPSDKERGRLKELLGGMLGFPELELRDPPRLEDVALAKPRIEVPSELATFASSDREARIRRSYGRAFPDLLRGFEGRFEHPPDVVAAPTSEQEIEQALAWASRQRVAVVPYGGGTSVVAGVEADVPSPFAGTLTLDLGELDELLEVDEASRLARAQAGIRGPALNDALSEHGLQLRHYPQSYEFSTLGGWIATRAGGHFATVYTHIDDLTHSVRMVAPGGVLETGRFPASGAGPDPKRLVLGSEGAIGVITEAWMRVQPRPPHRSRATVHFDAWDGAVEAVRAIAQAGLSPANLRLLDGDEAMLNQVSFGGEPVLMIGFEGLAGSCSQAMETALELAAGHGGRCPEGASHEDRSSQQTSQAGGEDGGSRWRRAFLDAPYLFNALVSMGVVVDTFETCTTWERFPTLHAALQREVRAAMDEACGMGWLSTRFTHVYPDGPAPYYTFIAPGERGRELDQWRAIKQAALDTLAAHGGTVTHHHAVGRTHRAWYEAETSARFLDALRAAKASLDPQGIMNPGALLGLDEGEGVPDVEGEGDPHGLAGS